jgi:hypothetical protein
MVVRVDTRVKGSKEKTGGVASRYLSRAVRQPRLTVLTNLVAYSGQSNRTCSSFEFSRDETCTFNNNPIGASFPHGRTEETSGR